MIQNESSVKYFLKSIGYLIRISLFSIDSSFLEHEYLLLFFMGLNLIDWISLLFTLLFQYYLFSKGHKFMKYFINFSGLLVYFGILFFFIILFAEYNQQLQDSFFEILEFENIFVENNIVPFFNNYQYNVCLLFNSDLKLWRLFKVCKK